LFSPTGRVAPSSNFQSGPTDVYADVKKPPANVPHQTAATGEEYAVSTKANKPGSVKQPEEYAQVDKSKKAGHQPVSWLFTIYAIDWMYHREILPFIYFNLLLKYLNYILCNICYLLLIT